MPDTAPTQRRLWARRAEPCLSIFLAALAISITAVTLPELSREFATTGIDPTLVVPISILATMSFIVPAGRAGDLVRKCKVLAAGLLIHALSAGAAGHASTIERLILGRFGRGLGAAAMPLAMVRDVVPAGHVGRWMGTLSAIGTASALALGGLILASFGRRVVYAMRVPAGLLAAVLCLSLIQDRKRPDARTSIDLPRAASLALFLSTLTLPLSGAGSASNTAAAIVLMVMASAFAALLAIEARSRSPIIPPILCSPRT